MFYIKRAVVALGLLLAISYTVLGYNPYLAEEFGLDEPNDSTWFEIGSQLGIIGS